MLPPSLEQPKHRDWKVLTLLRASQFAMYSCSGNLKRSYHLEEIGVLKNNIKMDLKVAEYAGVPFI
jgi:hypothetical protein